MNEDLKNRWKYSPTEALEILWNELLSISDPPGLSLYGKVGEFIVEWLIELGLPEDTFWNAGDFQYKLELKTDLVVSAGMQIPVFHIDFRQAISTVLDALRAKQSFNPDLNVLPLVPHSFFYDKRRSLNQLWFFRVDAEFWTTKNWFVTAAPSSRWLQSTQIMSQRGVSEEAFRDLISEGKLTVYACHPELGVFRLIGKTHANIPISEILVGFDDLLNLEKVDPTYSGKRSKTQDNNIIQSQALAFSIVKQTANFPWKTKTDFYHSISREYRKQGKKVPDDTIRKHVENLIKDSWPDPSKNPWADLFPPVEPPKIETKKKKNKRKPQETKKKRKGKYS